MFKRICRVCLQAGIAIIATTLLVCELPVRPDEYEPNDEFADAFLIPLGTIEATIEPDGDEDYYRISLPGDTTVPESVLLFYDLIMPAVFQPEIFFYSSEEDWLGGTGTDTAGVAIHDSITAPAGDIVLRVRSLNYESSPLSYTLTLTLPEPVVVGD